MKRVIHYEMSALDVKLDIEKLAWVTLMKNYHDYILILKPLKNRRIDQLIVRKITKIVATRCLDFSSKCSKLRLVAELHTGLPKKVSHYHEQTKTV